MLVTRQKLVKCPCCNSDFFLRFPDEFYILPLSSDQSKFLKDREAIDKGYDIKTEFII